MSAVANCLSCEVAFLTAAAWTQHLEDVHRPVGDTVCPLCGVTVPIPNLLWHPCVGDVLGVERSKALHPSGRKVAADPTRSRDESEPTAPAHAARLRLVAPLPNKE